MARRIKYIVNHWADMGPKTTVSDIRAIHLRKGWRDIGYHRIILHPESKQFERPPEDWWSLVKTGRYLNEDLYVEEKEVGAHTLHFNSVSVGVCTVGMPGLALHPLQREAIIRTNRVLVNRFQLDPKAAIKGHRDFNPTQCPGDEIYALLSDIRNGRT